MSRRKTGQLKIREKDRPLRIGFIPLSDCAPLVFARESGLFEKYDLRVELHRQTTWAAIRDRIMDGELDAAQAPATLPFVANLGLDSDPCACLTGLVLSLQGNALTISRHLWEEGVRDAKTLRDLIYRKWGKKTFTFGVAFPFSPSYLLLHHWLKSGGIVPRVEVRIVVLPPDQLFPTLKLGYVDGYCTGEPWNSLAMEAQVGVCVATSAELAPRRPDKVLIARRDFAGERAREHERLIAALLEACAFCDEPENRLLLGEMLSQPHYVNAPADCLKDGLAIPESASGCFGASIFHRGNANDPTEDKAAWLVDELHELMDHRILKIPSPGPTSVLKNVFKREVFARARAVLSDEARTLKVETERYMAGADEAA